MVALSVFHKDKKSPAFQRDLYKLHFRRLYNTCLRIVGNPMDAEEAMHDVFLKIFDHIDGLQDEKAFISWSQRIAIRTSIDRVRRINQVFVPLDEQFPVACQEPETEMDEEIELSVDAIKREMSRLPDGYRIVLSMRLLEEIEFDEIARTLQIKESTVRSQYVRGREKLASLLKKKNYESFRRIYQ